MACCNSLLPLLLLLVVLAGPGPGAAVAHTSALEPLHTYWHWHSSLHQQQPHAVHQHRHRHLLQTEEPLSAGCNATAELPGCQECSIEGGVWRCSSCAGNLLLLRSLNACGCPAGSFSSGPNACRDCPKGSFCPGGRYGGEADAGAPAAIPCATLSPGLTTLGVRTTRREGCVNLPGWSFNTLPPDNAPVASPCPADSYQFGLRKQRACVPCPPGYTTFGRTMQTSIAACDIDACLQAPCPKNMDCVDLPKPALGGASGRNCTCVPGTTFVDDVMGCSDPAETAMVGAPLPTNRAVTSFEMRCPRGSFIVAFSGTADTRVQSLGPVSCSDGSGQPVVTFGLTSGSRFTTALSPDGFTGLVVTAWEGSISSISFTRRDGAFSLLYGQLAEVALQYGRRQFLTCPNDGVATGLTAVKTEEDGAPVTVGLICSGLPCAVRPDTMFGPANAPSLLNAPGSYLQNSPPPIQTATATQCCSSCRHDFRCQFWVREDSTGTCWLVHNEPSAAGVGIPSDWAFQSVAGFQSGATQTKASGISVHGTYAGCYRDTGCNPSQRLQAVLAQNEPRLTVQQCVASALLAGWQYAGLAPGTVPGTSSCFGGNRLPAAAVNPGCFAPCAGNSSERCGDTGCVVSVYSVLKPRWPLELLNTGDSLRGSGWYDVQCQGAVNDFCRFLGRGNSSYYSCAMAGAETPNTLPGQVPESFATGAACQEPGYKAQPVTDLSCASGDLSLPWDNGCRTRQCCKARCDRDPLCNGFVFGNSAANNCRAPGDGQNCCWLKGGSCQSVTNPLTTAWKKTEEAAVCATFPPDPRWGIMFCPDNGNEPWPQGTRCHVECKYGPLNSDQRPYTICQSSNGVWSDLVGLCKPPCTLPPLLCP